MQLKNWEKLCFYLHNGSEDRIRERFIRYDKSGSWSIAGVSEADQEEFKTKPLTDFIDFSEKMPDRIIFMVKRVAFFNCCPVFEFEPIEVKEVKIEQV